MFNAPGANANSVKELVVAGMLLAARNLPAALAYARSLPPQDMKKAVERGKKQFAGQEIAGGTLGVIGLGAIGYRVANTAVDLGMRVLGYDPGVSEQHASQLSAQVHRVNGLERLLAESDFVTLHVPLTESTRGLLDARRLGLMPRGAVLLNFARDELVDEQALTAALDAGELRGYVTDFPNPTVHAHDKVIALPHLGASTSSAEDNCAIMVADELQDFLENGNITYSVNFPGGDGARSALPRRDRQRQRAGHARADVARARQAQDQHPQHAEQVQGRDGVHAGRRRATAVTAEVIGELRRCKAMLSGTLPAPTEDG